MENYYEKAGFLSRTFFMNFLLASSSIEIDNKWTQAVYDS